MKKEGKNRLLGILVGLLGLTGVVIGLLAGLPNRYIVADVRCTQDFNIERLRTSSGTSLIEDCDEAEGSASWKVGLFSFGSLPLVARGTVSSSTENTYYWVVLEDQFGRFYIQNPAIRVEGDTWSMSNIRPGKEIARIIFCSTDVDGNREFRRIVDANIGTGRWPALDALPPHEVRATVDLSYIKGFPYI